MEEIKLTRKKLYDLVWTESILSLSKKLNISDIGLRKICIKMNIPIPLAGHWMKVKYGKPITVFEFPIKFEGKDEIIINPAKFNNTSDFYESKKLLKQDTSLNFTVPKNLKNPHKYTIELKKQLDIVNSYDVNFINSDKFIPSKFSRKFSNRVLCFFDTLIKLFQSKNYEIGLKENKFYICIKNQSYEFSIREKQNRVIDTSSQSPWNSTKLINAGKLVLKFSEFRSYGTKEWEDGNKLLEEQLITILTYIEFKANKDYIEEIERKARWAIQAKERRIREEKQKQIEQELIEFNLLIEKANRHNQCKIILEYLVDSEKSYQSKNEKNKDFENWLKWAKEKVDWYDPLINKDDLIFKDVNKTTLNKKNNY